MLKLPKLNRLPYPHGWMIWDSGTYGHYIHNDGGQSDTSCYLVIIPEKKIAVAVMAKLGKVGSEFREIAFALVDQAIEQRIRV